MLWLVGLPRLGFFTRLEYTYLPLLQSGWRCNDFAHQLWSCCTSCALKKKERIKHIEAEASEKPTCELFPCRLHRESRTGLQNRLPKVEGNHKICLKWTQQSEAAAPGRLGGCELTRGDKQKCGCSAWQSRCQRWAGGGPQFTNGLLTFIIIIIIITIIIVINIKIVFLLAVKLRNIRKGFSFTHDSSLLIITQISTNISNIFVLLVWNFTLLIIVWLWSTVITHNSCSFFIVFSFWRRTFIIDWLEMR